jgi:uncharacterized protein YjiS (DUF1127 family)
MPNRTAPTFMHNKSGFFRVIARTAVALREKTAAAIERRRIRRALGKLDDYMLKDMGIARSDVERIANRIHSPR